MPWAASLFRYAAPDVVVLTYQCHVRKCGEIYAIAVRHFARAS